MAEEQLYKKCPVCNGSCLVRSYGRVSHSKIVLRSTGPCLACKSRGFVEIGFTVQCLETLVRERLRHLDTIIDAALEEDA